jgi:hypothetical protein
LRLAPGRFGRSDMLCSGGGSLHLRPTLDGSGRRSLIRDRRLTCSVETGRQKLPRQAVRKPSEGLPAFDARDRLSARIHPFPCSRAGSACRPSLGSRCAIQILRDQFCQSVRYGGFRATRFQPRAQDLECVTAVSIICRDVPGICPTVGQPHKY